MDVNAFLKAVHLAEKLKDTPRHCFTSGGRRESVAEHSWRTALMALWLKEVFPEADMDKVIRMCLIHDLGEAFTGDIPVFSKTAADEAREDALLRGWLATLPDSMGSGMLTLLREMDARETLEAKIYKALDSIEAVIQHNESDIATWAPHEYALNMNYARERLAFSEFTNALREAVRIETRDKIDRVRTYGPVGAGEAYPVLGLSMSNPTRENYLRRISGAQLNACRQGSHLLGAIAVKDGEIVAIAVDEAFRHQGVGGRMIREAAGYWGALVAETDDFSVSFYRKCGFECMPFTRTFPDGSVRRYKCISRQ